MTLAEVEAAAASLPIQEQKKLFDWLAARVPDATSQRVSTHSVLDIPAVSVGGILKPLTRDDDLLDEMLEGRV